MRLLGVGMVLVLGLGACHVEAVDPSAESSSSQLTPSTAHMNEVRALAKPFIDGEWVAGVAIGLVDDGKVETYGFGRVRDDEPNVAPNENTVFEIGSISKVFTSLLLSDAVNRGAMSLDQPVNELLPAGARLPSREGRDVTLRQLSTHSAGLPPLPANLTATSLENPYASYSRADLHASLPGTALASTPGTKYAYSNLGAGLLGQVLADHAQSSYGRLVAQKITGPLQMSATGIELPSANVAEGHDSEGTPAPYWDFLAMAGAGAIRSNVHDFVTFLDANLHPPKGEAGAMLSLAQEMSADLPEQRMGLGWHIFRGGPLDAVRWHNGQTGGCHSFAAIDRAKNKGVVVLANTAELSVDRLGIALLRMLQGEPQTITLPPTVNVAEAKLESYVGTYRLAPNLDFVVTREGARLYVQLTGQARYRVYPKSETSFYYRVVNASIDFELDGKTVGALVLHQGGADHRAPRVN